MTLRRRPQEKAMRQQQMTRLINSLSKLTHHQRQQLAAALGALSARSQVSEVIEARATSKPERGLLRTSNKVINQRNEIVAVYNPLRMVKTRPSS